MGKLGGFLKIERHGVPYRDSQERARDYREFLLPRPVEERDLPVEFGHRRIVSADDHA